MAAFCGSTLPLTHSFSRSTLPASWHLLTPLRPRFERHQTAIPTQRGTILCRGSSGQHQKPLNLLAYAAAAVILTATPFTSMFIPQPVAAKPAMNSAPLRFQQSLLQEEQDLPEKLRPQWDVKSVNSETETFLMFSNDSSSVVDLWWIDYLGHEVYYASINPGTTHMQPSYATHPWVIRDHISQNSMLVLVAEAQPAMAIVNNV